MNVHFQCVIQVCRFNCPDPVCPDGAPPIENRQDPAGLNSVNSYAGPSFTTARSFVVPVGQNQNRQVGQVSQALPPIQASPQFNQVLAPHLATPQPQPQLSPGPLPPGIIPNQINIATQPVAPSQQGAGGRRRQGPPRGPSARVDPRIPLLQRQKQHQSRYNYY